MQTTTFLELVKAGDSAAVREALAAEPALAKARDEQGVSALMLAAYHGAPDELRAALRDALGELDVFEAATAGDTARLRALLDRDPELVRAWSADRATALHFAAFFAQPEAARLLVERGANVHAVSPTFGDVTPLHSAAASASSEIVVLLLEHGGDPNARQSGGFVALHAAAQNGDLRSAEALLVSGADVSAATDDGRTARSFADDQGHAAVAALLDARGSA
jgi:uncharacterized protein